MYNVAKIRTRSRCLYNLKLFILLFTLFIFRYSYIIILFSRRNEWRCNTVHSVLVVIRIRSSASLTHYLVGNSLTSKKKKINK